MLREALDRFFEHLDAPSAPTEEDSLWGIVGLVDLGEDDISERIDEVLYGPAVE